jgi:hypothetical protein
MEYKIKCPACETRLSRWRYFSSLSIHYRCRNCGGRFRMTAQGFAITFAVAGVQLVWFCLGVVGVLQPYVAFDFLAATCALAIWLLPNYTPVQAERLPGKND